MNNPFKKIIALAVASVCTVSVFAQSGEVKVNAYYNYSLPTGSFKNDVISKGSPYGAGVDVLYWFNPKFALGGSVGYQDYYEKYPRANYKLTDGSDISAVMSNSIKITPIMVKGTYSFLGDKRQVVQPYVTAGAGINLINYAQLLGQFTSTSGNNVNLVAQAGAGVKIAVGARKSTGILLGATYNYAPYNKFGIKNVSSVNLQAGVQFSLD